jgi:NAD(P)-dependent dehydrogenase (short-subunit alcohol dehydrogenase family)
MRSDADVTSLAGSVALVTGASSGLGRGSALELGRAGARILCVGRHEDALQSVARELGRAGVAAEIFVADVTDDEAVSAAVDRAAEIGELRIVANAAGISIPGPASTYPMEDWDAQFAINVRGLFSVCRSAGAVMLERGTHGSIINFSSTVGTIAFPNICAYVTSKHAVEGLTKALAVEWAPSGIRVNAVAPSVVETPFVSDLINEPGFRELIEARTPEGRLIEVDEVSRAVAYLACDASSGVTGHVLRIDGGWTAC